MPFIIICFNTASGKHYCNVRIFGEMESSTITGFNTASGKHYCNGTDADSSDTDIFDGFNTASGKHYCNAQMLLNIYKNTPFQYRKR